MELHAILGGGARIGHQWGGCMLHEIGDALAVDRFPWDETGDAFTGPHSLWGEGTGTTAGKIAELRRVSTRTGARGFNEG